MKTDNETSPISFPVNVARLPQRGMPVTIDADEAQRTELARTHGLIAVDALHAEVMVTSWKRNGVKISGRVTGSIRQECVVTLEPLEAGVDEEIEAVFLPEDSKLGREGFHEGGEILLDPDGPDSPDTFRGDSIDVGALVEEFFGLGIDPYPRKEGLPAEFSTDPDGGEEETEFQKKLRALARKL